MTLQAQIAERFSTFERVERDEPNLTRASVAIIVTATAEQSEPGVLLTRRAANLRRHAGQYALPGGRMDVGETPIETAFRECEEEIGLRLGEEHVAGLLDDFVTQSGFCITPVVGFSASPMTPIPDPGEVEKVFHIPLSELESATTHLPEEAPADGDRDGFSIMLPTVGHRIYAPTAAMLFQFREVVLLNRYTRVAHLRQPQFAWR